MQVTEATTLELVPCEECRSVHPHLVAQLDSAELPAQVVGAMERGSLPVGVRRDGADVQFDVVSPDVLRVNVDAGLLGVAFGHAAAAHGPDSSSMLQIRHDETLLASVALDARLVTSALGLAL